MAQKADCTLRSGLFGQPEGGDCGCWRCFVLVVFFVGRVCSCGGPLSCGAVCRCVLGTEAVIFLLAAAFRVMLRAMPFSFLSLEAFSAGNTFLLSGICDILYQRGPPTVRNMRAVLKKSSSGTRRIFGSIRCKKQASTVRNEYSVPEPPFSGTGHVCQHPKISGNRYCNRMGRRNVGFDEENQRSFGLLPSNFVSLQNGIEVWCNGSTTDFGSACPSSNLGTSTFLREVRHY